MISRKFLDFGHIWTRFVCLRCKKKHLRRTLTKFWAISNEFVINWISLFLILKSLVHRNDLLQTDFRYNPVCYSPGLLYSIRLSLVPYRYSRYAAVKYLWSLWSEWSSRADEVVQIWWFTMRIYPRLFLYHIVSMAVPGRCSVGNGLQTDYQLSG